MKTTTQSEAPSERAWMQSCAWRYQVCVDSILLYDGSGLGLRKRDEQNRHEQLEGGGIPRDLLASDECHR